MFFLPVIFSITESIVEFLLVRKWNHELNRLKRLDVRTERCSVLTVIFMLRGALKEHDCLSCI